MREMEEDDEENYGKHFASYVAAELDADDLEELYEKVHASIREDPSREKAEPFTDIDRSFKKGIKKTYEERKADAAAKKASLRPQDDEDEEEEEGEAEEEDDE